MPLLRSVKTLPGAAKRVSSIDGGISRHPLTIAAVSFVLTGVIGSLIATYIAEITKSAEVERQRIANEAQAERQHTADRKVAVQNFSREIYARRTRLELLASAIRRNSATEIRERKIAYDEAYVKWNTNAQTNLFIVRETIEEQEYSIIESAVEFLLVGNFFGPLDACLTSAYDAFVGNGGNPPDQPRAVLILDKCDSRSKLIGALDCGYSITNGLYRLVSSIADKSQVAAEMESRCQLRESGVKKTFSRASR